MEVRNELKSLIAKNATTLKRVCEILTTKKGKSYIGNNITNKLRRKTIKFEEVQDILEVLGYHIEFIKNKN
jgi:DNA-binding transcriptional regulator GbsR (MarR family)